MKKVIMWVGIALVVVALAAVFTSGGQTFLNAVLNTFIRFVNPSHTDTTWF